MDFRGLFSSRKVKYGSVAVAFTVIFIAIVVAFNAILSAVDSKVGLYIDMTHEQIYDISAQSEALLSTIDEEVRIIFCRDEDKISENYYMNMIKTLAQKYEAKYPNIKVEYIDVNRRGKELEKYRPTTSTAIGTSNIIIDCPNIDKHQLLTNTSFFTFGESDTSAPFAFNGEMRFTSTILSLTSNTNDKIFFTTGHGEAITSTAILEMIINAGYSSQNILTIDLSSEQIPSDAKLVIVNNPIYDFAGSAAEKTGGTNEIEKLNEYLKSYGNLLVFLNSSTGELTELRQFLNDGWGIDYHSGEMIIEGASNSIAPGGEIFKAEYAVSGDEDVYANEITKRLDAGTGSAPKTILSNATPVYILDGSKRVVSSVLETSAGAKVLESGKAVASGKVPTFVISTYQQLVDGKLKCGHVMVCGSTEFTSSAYINSQGALSYGNADMFYSILQLLDNSIKAPINIDFRVFEDTSITVDMANAKTVTLFLCGIFPLVVLALGAVIWIRRRHS